MKKLKNKWRNIVGIIAFVVLTSVIIFTVQGRNKTVTLELGIFAGSNWDVPNPENYKMFDEIISKFEKAYPGIKVTYRSGTLKEDYSEWLAQKIINGKQPDVFVVLSSDFNTFSSIGVMKDLNKLIENDQDFDREKLYTNALKSGQFRGHQYALPLEVVPVLMFANRTLLRNEGIEVPKGDWTWEDFYDICQRVTKDTDGDGKIDQFGTYGFTWQHAVYTNGQNLFDANGTTAYFEPSEVLESINFIKKLNELNQNFKPTSDDFDLGKVAFRPFPFSTYRAYKPYPLRVKKYSSFEWEGIKMPKGPNGNNAAELYSFLIGMSSITNNEKEAWELIKYLTTDESIQLSIFGYSHGVSALKNVNESDEAGEILLRDNPDEETVINMDMLEEVIENSIVIPSFEKYEEAMSMADKELFQVINGDKNAETSLSIIQREIEKFLIQ